MRRPSTPHDRAAALASLVIALGLVAASIPAMAAQVEPSASPTAPSPSATPTASPVPTPALSPSVPPSDPTPRPDPSPIATPAPTPEPTSEPTPEPTSEPTPEPSPELLTLGATHGTFTDDFSVPGVWGVVDDDQARIDYADESLLFTFKQPGGRWTTRPPAQVSPGMRLDVDVVLGPGVASAGAMCGRNGPPTDFALGAVTPNGTWGLGRMVDNVPSTLASGSLEGIDIVIDEPVRLAIECSTTETGERVAFWVNGQLVADISGDEPRGPYDRVGLYAYGAEPDSTVRFDEAYAYDAGPVPGLTTLGAETPVFTDDFSAAGDWGTLDEGADQVAVEDGQLVITVGQAGASRWTTRQLPAASNEARVELAVDVPPDGSTAGPMCLTADPSPIAAIGVIDAEDQWIVGRIVDGEFGLISTGQLVDHDVVPGVPVPVALECAVTADGERIALWIDGQLVADVVTDLQHGPWAAVGAYGDALSAEATSRFDDAVVLSGEPAGPLGSLGADVVVFEDAFDDPTEWATGRTRQARVDYANDALRFRFSRPGSVWSSQPYTEALPIVGLEATFIRRAGSGAAGVMCGRPGEPLTYYAATLDTKGDVALHLSAGSELTELSRVPLPGGVVAGDRVRIKVECAVASPDADRVVVWVDGDPVLDYTTSGSFGSFDQVALFASTSGRRFEVRADDAVMSAGFTYAPAVVEVPATG